MKFDVLTLFPELFELLNQSIIGKAIEKDLIDIKLINIRDFSKDKHKKVDDTPYGGGAGMIMKPDVVYDAYQSVKDASAKVIYMSPQGKPLNQKKVEELSKENHLIILCGHYEGIDQRVLDKIVDEEISIGDYVLTGGEIPSMVLVDSITRLLPGVIKEERGIIDIPIRLDVDNRPYQIADYEHGKKAITEWKRLGIEVIDGKKYTRVRFFPHTGRTHQLRVHSALTGHPIKGDRLYGTRQEGERLMLHSALIEFRHPATGECMVFTSPSPF